MLPDKSLPSAFLSVATQARNKKSSLLAALAFLSLLSFGRTLYGADFFCPGDTTGGLLEGSIAAECIREAIDVANNNGESNTIFLDDGPGSYLFSGTAVIGSVTGPFPLTIRGPGPQKNLGIRHPSGSPSLFIAPQASLTLKGLTINSGGTFGNQIRNEGTLNIIDAEIRGLNISGLSNAGTANVINSTIRENEMGIENSGFLKITNSTIGNNGGFIGNDNAPGVSNTGTLYIVNSTIARNVGVGISNLGNGNIELQNSIVALNNGGGPDCEGAITSLGNNLVGDPTGCALSFDPTDLNGDPGLGEVTDNGPPGRGYFPLLENSQAIDRGNNSLCSSDQLLATDQLGNPRSVAGKVDGPRVCDIGAVEFFPSVNNLVELREVITQFDPTPASGAPAGTFLITAKFENVSDQTIVYPFFEVVSIELRGGPGSSFGPVLLNADYGPGEVGARLTPKGTPLEPAGSRTFEFLIGLRQQEPFTFLVNMLGEPQTSNPSISIR